jgi:hypothetical protein
LAYRPSTVSLDEQLVGIFTPFWRGCFDVEKMLVIQVAQQGGMFQTGFFIFRTACFGPENNQNADPIPCISPIGGFTNYPGFSGVPPVTSTQYHIYVDIHLYINTTVSHHIIYIYMCVCLYLYAYTIIDFLLYIIFHVSINLLYIYTSICQYIYRYEGFLRWRCPKMGYRIDPIKMI